MKKTGWLYRHLRSGYLLILDFLKRKKGVRVRINDFNIQLPGLYSRHFPKDYERQNFEFLKNTFKPGMTGIDIGAHLGIYSIRMSQLGASRVFSFEPTPSTFRVLKKVISMNNCEQVIKPGREAIGEISGKGIFHLNEPVATENRMTVSEANSLKFIEHGPHIKKSGITLDLLSIDDLVKKNQIKVDFIKIDAEGSESDILRGAFHTIQRDKPSGIISVHNFTYKDRVLELSKLWALIQNLQMTILHENKPIGEEQLLNLAPTDIFDLQFSTG